MKNKIKYLFLLLAFLLYLTTKISSEEPLWLESVYTVYPKIEFEVAVGEGNSYEEAVTNATSNIIRAPLKTSVF